jgi:hypothetical protein
MIGERLMCNDLKEAGCALIKTITWNLAGRTEGNLIFLSRYHRQSVPDSNKAFLENKSEEYR